MKKLLVFSAFSVLLLVSCMGGGSGKKGTKSSGIPADKKEYVGNWQSEEMQLDISEKGHVDYKRVNGSSTTSVSAPIQRFNGDDFEAGMFGFDTKFDVTEKPHEVDGSWKMTVDGVELTRQ